MMMKMMRSHPLLKEVRLLLLKLSLSSSISWSLSPIRKLRWKTINKRTTLAQRMNPILSSSSPIMSLLTDVTTGSDTCSRLACLTSSQPTTKFKCRLQKTPPPALRQSKAQTGSKESGINKSNYFSSSSQSRCLYKPDLSLLTRIGS